MRKYLCLLFILLAAFITGCEGYEVVPENSLFRIACVAQDGNAFDGAPFEMSILHGAIEGDCYLTVSLKGEDGGPVVGFRVLANGRTPIESTDAWKFDSDGKASFTITKLPAGKYSMRVSVLRWYHTAVADADFEIKNK